MKLRVEVNEPDFRRPGSRLSRKEKHGVIQVKKFRRRILTYSGQISNLFGVMGAIERGVTGMVVSPLVEVQLSRCESLAHGVYMYK